MNLRKTLVAAVAATALLPGTALAHDGGDGRYGSFHHHRHHHSGVLLKGTVTSVDTSNSTLTVAVAKASRGGKALVGDTVTVKAVKGWVADTNNDGKRSIADVQNGDTVLVFTKRRFINADANTVSAAFVIDKTHPKSTDRSSFRSAYRDGVRDGNCDHR
jgi:hypothetical protein